MGPGAVPWENHRLENDFSSTSVQIENSRSLPKVYTTSMVDACTRARSLEYTRVQLPKIEKRTVERRERREERRC